MLTESIHNNAKFKFVFLSGGPGAGQDYLEDRLFDMQIDHQLEDNGLKLVSSDIIFERLLQKANIRHDAKDTPDVEKVKAAHIRKVAAKLSMNILLKLQASGTGIIFDARTLHPYQMLEMQTELEHKGYDVYVLFIDIPLETLLNRNNNTSKPKTRPEVKQLWHTAKENKRRLIELFGENVLSIEHEDDQNLPNNLHTAIDRIIAAPLKNTRGQLLLQKKHDDDHVSLRSLVDKNMAHPKSHGPIMINQALGYAPDSNIRRTAERILNYAQNKKREW